MSRVDLGWDGIVNLSKFALPSKLIVIFHIVCILVIVCMYALRYVCAFVICQVVSSLQGMIKQ